MKRPHIDVKGLFVREQAQLLARCGLLALEEIQEEDLAEACFVALQHADSYLLKCTPGMRLAAIPQGVAAIPRFACLLKAGPTGCWIVVTEQSENAPLRAAVYDTIEDLLNEEEEEEEEEEDYNLV
jgi:hypothetical protein